jgi:hypothetical protein
MADSSLPELQARNADLCRLVIRLSTIILRNIAEQRELAVIRGNEIAPQLLVAITPVGIVSRLRETSIRCSELSRNCCDGETARTLEGLGVELATEAESFEALLKVSGPEA